jgi:hypothetical protein
MAAESPEEDNYLFGRDFHSVMFAPLVEVPEYNRWLKSRDMRPSYHYARRQLQLLSWKYRADHWVLKAPAHLSWLDELLEAFPDASVIVMHRDPLQVIPSTCSLMAGFRGIVTDHLDLRRLGTETVEELAWRCQRMIAARARLDPARFLDVSYERMVADPISTIREACRHFGYDFTPECEARARRYVAENPRHKHGAHRSPRRLRPRRGDRQSPFCRLPGLAGRPRSVGGVLKGVVPTGSRRQFQRGSVPPPGLIMGDASHETGGAGMRPAARAS